jgi:hypothetical protein
MPVSRGRKPKDSPPKPRKEQFPQSPKTRWERIRDHPIPWVLALIAALIAIGGFLQQLLVSPEISALPDVDVSAPFILPFSVRNNSLFFEMKGAQLYCGVDRVIFDNDSGLISLSLVSNKIAIAPLTEGNFRCLIGKNGLVDFGPRRLKEGHIFLSVHYATLGISRMSPEVEFTWYTETNPPRWVRGKISH